MRLLITSGGTKVPIDSVRHIGNMSSGTMGNKIAIEALSKEHHVDFLTSKDGYKPSEFSIKFNRHSYSMNQLNNDKELASKELEKHFNFMYSYGFRYSEYLYSTYDEYSDKLFNLIDSKHYDAIILVAAVSDYGVNKTEGKISSSKDFSIGLKRLPKLLPLVKDKVDTRTKVVGFKLTADKTPKEVLEISKKQMDDYGIDMVVGNDIIALRNNEYYQIIISKTKHGIINSNLIEKDFEQTIIRTIESL
jgi:phosphopantothenoylcysteine decarboxylase/phosphopantothenate--cysteine ligase